MSTIRYTPQDDYLFPETSAESFYFMYIDDNTADYTIDQVYIEGASKTGYVLALKDQSQHPTYLYDAGPTRNLDINDGVLFDFSTLTTGTLQAHGGNKGDVLYGGASADTLFGEGGDDTLVGGDGADVLTGGQGADYLDGGTGDDMLTGEGFDTLLGGGGNDTVLVTGNWAAIDGGDGADRLVIRSDDGSAVIARADSITGIERVIVRGGTEVDLSALTQAARLIQIIGPGAEVTGTQDADGIVGGARADTIFGGGGSDILSGGAGADTFAYRAGDLAAGRAERIIDFSGVGGQHDRIDVSALGITGVHKGAFDADGTAQLRIGGSTNGSITLTFDLDGDGTHDASLRVTSDAPLTAADFVFAKAPLSSAFTAGMAIEHASHQPFAELFHPIGHGVIA